MVCDKFVQAAAASLPVFLRTHPSSDPRFPVVGRSSLASSPLLLNSDFGPQASVRGLLENYGPLLLLTRD